MMVIVAVCLDDEELHLRQVLAEIESLIITGVEKVEICEPRSSRLDSEVLKEMAGEMDAVPNVLLPGFLPTLESLPNRRQKAFRTRYSQKLPSRRIHRRQGR